MNDISLMNKQAKRKTASPISEICIHLETNVFQTHIPVNDIILMKVH